MSLNDETTAAALNRLKRARGQLNGVIDMIEQGRDCRDIVTQLAAVSRALDRAGVKVISGGMRECIRAAENGEQPELSEDELEKMFLSLS
ncbi:metal-sensitive transcriptional regulator [Corynebacterium nuruki]|jgi:DNA-binding FrmR family transcriptional regulator|uniref:Transcriptional regulator n=1 Tax=Corynebacterium nuruki TaxID=1032851 RepID=A0A3D4SX36_9CORY|nr:metal-sensitive transcriptional regulator [Corynebacterium nuruki]MDN6438876.1 metal-sensitive transcriptional regulator [Corynebacterium nuruki]HCT13577.1 transcriptional regulator [Corynebacterium nuruki]